MKAVFDYQGTPQHLLITYAFAKTTKQHISRDYVSTFETAMRYSFQCLSSAMKKPHAQAGTGC
jgi:hypothetical protein